MSERDDPAAALRTAIDSVSELMTDYARYLQLEGSEHHVHLDPVELTVAVKRPGGRVPLGRMGSAENWVGYHLVAHLALHHWFCDERSTCSAVPHARSADAGIFFPGRGR
ncbi:DUF3732 domain-containing protein [Dermacoccus abyssi]|uniref:DUF3732 domain-containing protein n=1 Tax=Dermacoccus abyssi TaxID=322596 RepID=A0ABX5ZBQ0_9MICO|nr:DUF3732 domain-containing protein [Dermacoccus abyssi]